MRKQASVKILGTMLLLIKILSASFVIKVTKNLLRHNGNYVTMLASVYTSGHLSCFYVCGKNTAGRINLRRFFSDHYKCECMVASDEFRDSRSISTDLGNGEFVVNGWY